eukprot:1335943-Rhodomonas_salina.1
MGVRGEGLAALYKNPEIADVFGYTPSNLAQDHNTLAQHLWKYASVQRKLGPPNLSVRFVRTGQDSSYLRAPVYWATRLGKKVRKVVGSWKARAGIPCAERRNSRKERERRARERERERKEELVSFCGRSSVAGQVNAATCPHARYAMPGTDAPAWGHRSLQKLQWKPLWSSPGRC